MLKLLKSELITKKSFRLDQAHTHAPFTSSSARFKSKKVQARMAHLGPATYDVNSQSIAVQSIRDAILKKTMKGKRLLFLTVHSLPNSPLFVQITLQHVFKCGTQRCSVFTLFLKVASQYDDLGTALRCTNHCVSDAPFISHVSKTTF